MLNTTHANKKHKSTFKIPENARNTVNATKKSELGKLFLREQGKLKPVINIKTNKTSAQVDQLMENWLKML